MLPLPVRAAPARPARDQGSWRRCHVTACSATIQRSDLGRRSRMGPGSNTSPQQLPRACGPANEAGDRGGASPSSRPVAVTAGLGSRRARRTRLHRWSTPASPHDMPAGLSACQAGTVRARRDRSARSTPSARRAKRSRAARAAGMALCGWGESPVTSGRVPPRSRADRPAPPSYAHDGCGGALETPPLLRT
jgi:hypothetical protein